MYLGVGVVRRDPGGTITGYLPFGKLHTLRGTTLSALKFARQIAQQALLARMGNLSWDYDREALAREYRWNDELYKRDALEATDPNWAEKEAYWSAWFSLSLWKKEDIEFEEWYNRVKNNPELLERLAPWLTAPD